MLTWGSDTYVKRMLQNFELTFGHPPVNHKYHCPMDPQDHPELDESELCTDEERRQCWQCIGELQWLVALGRIDVMYTVNVLSRYRPAPRRGHLERVKRIYAFLKQYHKTAIKFNTEMPDYERLTVVEGNWGAQYHPCREDIPSNAPTPRGKPVTTTTFVDANLMADITTGRSQTGTIHLLNKTPIEWFSKRQNAVETATYGSEFVAARTAVDQVIELRHALRYLGVPVATVGGSSASYVFGDNLSVVNSSILPSGKLQKRAHILNYHRVREAQAAGVVRFVHVDGKENPADILTKPPALPAIGIV